VLAVPLHGEDVAPRFCEADQFMFVAADRDRAFSAYRLTFPEEEWRRRLDRLSAAGVRVLLCGGFNRLFLPVAEDLGIQVISGLAGKAERLIDAFLRDELDQYRLLPCRRSRSRCGWRGQDHRGATSTMRGEMQCRDEMERVR
jgi:predicted Fe-Mo cluster-binding NifX family protein